MLLRVFCSRFGLPLSVRGQLIPRRAQSAIEFLVVEVPLACFVLDIDVILRVDFRHDRVAHVCPRLLVEEIRYDLQIERDAAVFHLRRHRGEFAPVQCGAQIKFAAPP